MSDNNIVIVIRFSTASYPDLELPPVEPSQLTLPWLRKNVRMKLSDLRNKRLRFILSGRVINESTNLVDEYNRYIRFQSEDDGVDKKFYIHCLIGDILTQQELAKENEMDNKVQEQSTTPAPVGFDRLQNAGLSQEDINMLRRQFRQLYGDLPQVQNEADIRQLEERWIDSSVNHEIDDFNVATSNGGSGSMMSGNVDLLVGVLIGCLCGVLSVFLLMTGKLFNKRQKIAIVAGIIVNFSFALVRQWS